MKINFLLDMEEQTIINILEQRGYDTRSAKLVAGELLQLSNPLNKLFTEWIELESCKKDFSTMILLITIVFMQLDLCLLLETIQSLHLLID